MQDGHGTEGGRQVSSDYRGSVAGDIADSGAGTDDRAPQASPSSARRVAATSTPRRGDDTEQWLKHWRDMCGEGGDGWHVLDQVLDDYRLHADTGTPLGAEAPSSDHDRER
jgi:hypothetical protein